MKPSIFAAVFALVSVSAFASPDSPFPSSLADGGGGASVRGGAGVWCDGWSHPKVFEDYVYQIEAGAQTEPVDVARIIRPLEVVDPILYAWIAYYVRRFADPGNWDAPDRNDFFLRIDDVAWERELPAGCRWVQLAWSDRYEAIIEAKLGKLPSLPLDERGRSVLHLHEAVYAAGSLPFFEHMNAIPTRELILALFRGDPEGIRRAVHDFRAVDAFRARIARSDYHLQGLATRRWAHFHSRSFETSCPDLKITFALREEILVCQSPRPDQSFLATRCDRVDLARVPLTQVFPYACSYLLGASPAPAHPYLRTITLLPQ